MVSSLCTSIFEDPLILTTIMSFLDPCDVVCLATSVSKEERFVETIFPYLRVLETNAFERHERQQAQAFDNNLHSLVDILQTISINEERHHIRKAMCRLLDNILKEKRTLLINSTYDHMRNIVELKLIAMAQDNPFFEHNALFYLDELFDIHVKAHPNLNTGEIMEYVIDRNGHVYYI
jgi:hypothetical protein